MSEETPKLSPVPSGQLVKTFVRNDHEELSLTVDEYRDHKYLNLRLWAKLSDGQWWPTKKGVTVRLTEARELAEAIVSAMDCIENT